MEIYRHPGYYKQFVQELKKQELEKEELDRMKAIPVEEPTKKSHEERRERYQKKIHRETVSRMWQQDMLRQRVLDAQEEREEYVGPIDEQFAGIEDYIYGRRDKPWYRLSIGGSGLPLVS